MVTIGHRRTSQPNNRPLRDDFTSNNAIPPIPVQLNSAAVVANHGCIAGVGAGHPNDEQDFIPRLEWHLETVGHPKTLADSTLKGQ